MWRHDMQFSGSGEGAVSDRPGWWFHAWRVILIGPLIFAMWVLAGALLVRAASGVGYGAVLDFCLALLIVVLGARMLHMTVKELQAGASLPL